MSTPQQPQWLTLAPNASAGSTLPGRYCNSAQIQTSIWDFSIDFNHLVGRADPTGEESPSVVNYPVERVVMSPQHAKALATLLTRHVAAYEAQFGELPLPPEITAQIDSLKQPEAPQ